jgi:hypothetical protein
MVPGRKDFMPVEALFFRQMYMYTQCRKVDLEMLNGKTHMTATNIDRD